jgi:putative DNA-invertase from lambdoid prophage Rac
MASILYARVSTVDQTLSHQEEHARGQGFQIDQTVADHGVSGVSTRLREREEGKRLFDLLRRGDTLIVRWVDRLGRNYQDVSDTIREFMRKGVVVKTVINRMTFDGATTDPIQQAVRDALIGFMAATAQAQAEATKEAQNAGIAYAKSNTNNYKGRKPTYKRSQLQTVIELLSQNKGTTVIAKSTGLSRQTVLRIKSSPESAEAALSAWRL